MYSDIYAIMGMCGRATLNSSNGSLLRRGEQLFFRLPDNPTAATVRVSYAEQACELSGYEIVGKRKSYLAVSRITADFISLHGKKYKAIRHAVNKWKPQLSVAPITSSDTERLVSFVDRWAKTYGKAKYGMQLHAGYDKEFFRSYFNPRDFYGFIFCLNGSIVGYAVISAHLDDGALNYIIGKADNTLSNISNYIDYTTFSMVHQMRGDFSVCWGASTGSLLRYKIKFGAEVTECFFIKYRKVENRNKQITEALGARYTNVWDSTSVSFKLGKSKWNELIDAAGAMAGVENPRYATREGCMKGWERLSKMLTGKEINAGASVLDPFACELILKLFLPKAAKSVYNPFGGGVQMGFVAGFFGLQYLATEIRRNQCDANNAICAAMQLDGVRWACADSASYRPAEQFDMAFSCPPYYLLERYADYDGATPDGELSSLSEYGAFRDLLFAGYRNAIGALRDNRFFVIMVGDSRDKNGAYCCAEAETELFLRNEGLHIYNRIVYLENQITRTVMGSRTINSRKLPKVEQKIIVAYKGNLSNISALFAPLNFEA